MTANKKFVICSIVIIFAITFCSFGIKTIAQEQQNQQIYGYCVEIGGMYGISPDLIYAICERESRLQPNATDGISVGLMQITPRWHESRMADLGVTDLYDPRSNILVGTDYLYDLFKEYGDVSLVLMKYNGLSKAQELYNNGQMSEYAEWVLNRAYEREAINGKHNY